MEDDTTTLTEISRVLNSTNITTLFQNYSSVNDYVPYSQRIETYIVPVIFALIFILGVAGNGTLITIFLRHPNMRTIPNIYIFSLALGDLSVIICCVPFVSIVYTFESWPWGEQLCRLSCTMADVSIGVSVFTLTALSAERYCAIVKPMRRHVTTKSATITAVGIWVVSFLFASPALIFSHVETFDIPGTEYNICSPFKSYTHGQITAATQLVVYYLIPMVTIGFFYSLMARHLALSTRPLPGEHGKAQNAQTVARKKVAFMVLAFVILFIVCFLPTRLFTMWLYFNPNFEVDYDMFWHVFCIFGFCLQFLHSCINPIAMYFISKTFRRYFNYYLVCCPYQALVQEQINVQLQ